MNAGWEGYAARNQSEESMGGVETRARTGAHQLYRGSHHLHWSAPDRNPAVAAAFRSTPSAAQADTEACLIEKDADPAGKLS